MWFYPIHNLMNMPPTMLSDSQLVPYTNFDNHTIVVYPILTEYAYSKHGFYEYYNKTCGIECLTVTMNRNSSNYYHLYTDVGSQYWIHPQEETSNSAFIMLKKLNYHFITDIDIDKNPSILTRYTKVILLHNEYATQKEWDAIKTKQNVIYLYPNAMYAQVSINYDSNTESLVKGHDYQNITNAFNSGTTSKGEYDLKCKGSFWYKLQNGIEYSCYPELDILNNAKLLSTISRYPYDTSFNITTS